MRLFRSLQALFFCLPMMLVACQEAGERESSIASRSSPFEPGLDIVLNLESGSGQIEMIQGEKKNITTSLNVVNGSGLSLKIMNEVLIEPSSGLALKNDYPDAGQTTSSSVSYVINQSFTGQLPGSYIVTNRAYIPGSTIEASESFSVRVLPPGGDPLILPLGAWPSSVPPQGSSEVTFTAAITGFLSRPETLSLLREDVPGRPTVAALRDDGTQGDLLAGDGVYSAKLTIDSARAGALRYVATAAFPGVAGERSSAPFELKVTGRPTRPRPAQPDKAVTDTENDVVFLCDEVLVSFAEGFTESEQDALLDQRVGGTIVGGEPGLGIYQVHLPGPCTADNVYEALSRLREAPGIQTASPNFIGEADGFTPDDPQYASQYALDKLRADEAWVIARGSGVLVAVTDSGANFQHADLTGQVLKGYNYPAGNTNPLDDLGHGTSVASIIAARGDNAVGMAGVAWNSRILAIKVIGEGGSVTTSDGIAAIKSAADQGAKIINCSWGFWAGVRSIDTAPLEAAVQYATRKGALVVAASGNAGTERLRYPCAFDDVLCVGATDANDNRWSLSNYGGHVDLAAPGANITVPLLTGGYGSAQGTSYATAFVSGSAAVVWSYFPSWTARQVRQRMERTAIPMDSASLGSGRVDLFEAVFNGSFEDGIRGWSMEGTAGALRSLGPLVPRDRDKMAFVSSGPDSAQIQTTLDQAFTLQPGVETLTLRFDYNFVTEEYPEWVGTDYNDNIRISLLMPNGQETTLAHEDVNTAAFTAVPGIDFPGGDDTAGTTGWKTAIATLPVSAGPGRYRIRVRDEGDGTYDSNLLIDNIRFK
ncbi:S8 family serine peptidase [Cystobacter fuscus]|uniref:S8 family serine peptidase n=1 Tax=Cystobacter fuscus TaxID=43 RepID=UPI002B289D50|nr:S8 family serine peptidase [Cystobacter fuscus]